METSFFEVRPTTDRVLIVISYDRGTRKGSASGGRSPGADRSCKRDYINDQTEKEGVVVGNGQKKGTTARGER
jgi:hypothetical protein